MCRHTWWKAIQCPGCEKEFHIEKKQWKQVSLPLLISIAVLLGFQFFGKTFFDKDTYLIIYSIIFSAFIFVGLWWLHTVLTKLKFVHHVKT